MFVRGNGPHIRVGDACPRVSDREEASRRPDRGADPVSLDSTPRRTTRRRPLARRPLGAAGSDGNPPPARSIDGALGVRCPGRAHGRGSPVPVVGVRSAARDRGAPRGTPPPRTVGSERRVAVRGVDPGEFRLVRERARRRRRRTGRSGSHPPVEPARSTRIRVDGVAPAWLPHRRRPVSERSRSNPYPDDRGGDRIGGDGRVGTDASGPRATPGPRRPYCPAPRTTVAPRGGSATATSSHRSTSLRPTRPPTGVW